MAPTAQLNELIVYTAITGNTSDVLQPVILPEDPAGRSVKFVCYTDRFIGRRNGWMLRPLHYSGRTDRVTARWHKIMSHLLFPESEFTLWHDATHTVKRNPWELVDRLRVEDKSLATFQHLRRSTVYEELDICEHYRMDSVERFRSQRKLYMDLGYPANAGLYETRCVVRRSSQIVSTLNERWFEEIDQRSCRDQIALPFVIWTEKFNEVQIIPGSSTHNQFFHYRSHPRGHHQI